MNDTYLTVHAAMHALKERLISFEQFLAILRSLLTP